MSDRKTKFHYSNGGSYLRVDPSVTTIPGRACSGRSMLVEVELPESISEIGDDAFQCCSSLRRVKLSNGIRTIGEQLFGCTWLKHISVPPTVTVINNGAFHGCTSLRQFTALMLTVLEWHSYLFWHPLELMTCDSIAAFHKTTPRLLSWRIFGAKHLSNIMLTKAPKKIINFCLETCRRRDALPYDFGRMICRLSHVRKSGGYVQLIII